IEVLRPQTPIGQEHPFNAAAGCPANTGRRGAAVRKIRRIDGIHAWPSEKLYDRRACADAAVGQTGIFKNQKSGYEKKPKAAANGAKIMQAVTNVQACIGKI